MRSVLNKERYKFLRGLEQEWYGLRFSSTLISGIVILLLVCLLLPATHVHAEQSAEERLEEEGIVLLALRNDTIDTDQDGDIDAVRVVIVMNATTQESDLILKLRSLHKEREVLQIQEVSFENQTNVSLVYDAWSSGEHELRLDFFDQNGDFLASYPLPTFMLQPALKVPHVHLGLEAADDIKTGELCNIHREFADETGPRYGETGIRTSPELPSACLIPKASWIVLHGPLVFMN